MALRQGRDSMATTTAFDVTYLFTQTNQALLEEFARSNVLLAFDFDGTLAPLVEAPPRARIRASTRRWMRRATTLYPCVVLTGRSRADALAKLGSLAVSGVVGSHGGEPSPNARDTRRRVQQWLPSLRRRLSTQQGVVIENKGLSLAIHYRRAPKRELARRAILAAARSLNDVRNIGGKLVINLVVPEAADKGVALERQRTRLACDTVIYVGDDETDEDVFALDRRWPLLTIRVGRTRTSAASFYIRNQRQIDRLLRILVTVRLYPRRTSTPREC
jgi:trehalose 6-phosphate phosphatase